MIIFPANVAHFLWDCTEMGDNNFWVNIGPDYGLVPSANKPLSEPMLTQIYDVTRPQWANIPRAQHIRKFSLSPTSGI